MFSGYHVFIVRGAHETAAVMVIHWHQRSGYANKIQHFWHCEGNSHLSTSAYTIAASEGVINVGQTVSGKIKLAGAYPYLFVIAYKLSEQGISCEMPKPRYGVPENRLLYKQGELIVGDGTMSHEDVRALIVQCGGRQDEEQKVAIGLSEASIRVVKCQGDVHGKSDLVIASPDKATLAAMRMNVEFFGPTGQVISGENSITFPAMYGRSFALRMRYADAISGSEHKGFKEYLRGATCMCSLTGTNRILVPSHEFD